MVLTCKDCKVRPMKISYSDNPMMVLRGAMSATPLCRQCYSLRLERAIIEINKNLEEQKRMMITEGDEQL